MYMASAIGSQSLNVRAPPRIARIAPRLRRGAGVILTKQVTAPSDLGQGWFPLREKGAPDWQSRRGLACCNRLI